jgi:hypothetical protein
MFILPTLLHAACHTPDRFIYRKIAVSGGATVSWPRLVAARPTNHAISWARFALKYAARAWSDVQKQVFARRPASFSGDERVSTRKDDVRRRHRVMRIG